MVQLARYSNIVGGVAQLAAATFENFDSYTGKPWALIPRCNAKDVDRAVAAAAQAFRSTQWRGMTASKPLRPSLR